MEVLQERVGKTFGQERRDTLKLLATVAGFSLVGGGYWADVIKNGGKSKFLSETLPKARKERWLSQEDSDLLSYIPGGIGVAVALYLGWRKIESLTKDKMSRREFLLIPVRLGEAAIGGFVATGLASIFYPLGLDYAEIKAREEAYNKAELEAKARVLSEVTKETIQDQRATITLDNYNPESRKFILAATASVKEALLSKDDQRRLTAKHLLAWTFIAPLGDIRVYRDYGIKKMVPLKFDEISKLNYEQAAKLALFLGALDVATDFNESALVSDQQLANAFGEATWRCLALVGRLDNKDLWRQDKIVLTKVGFSMPGQIKDTNIGAPKYRLPKQGDTPDTITDKVAFSLPSHQGLLTRKIEVKVTPPGR